MPQPNNGRPAGGPGRHGGAAGGKIRIEKGTGKTIARLFKYMDKKYAVGFAFAMVCMVVSSLVSIEGSLFIRSLIDDYIAPMITQAVPDFSPLVKALFKLGGIYLAGMACTLIYNLMMVKVAHGILNSVRNDMFSHMQTLPIKYFDTNSYGDVMSRYTNDTDSMRQMLSQSIPQCLSSLVTIFAVGYNMVKLSWVLFLVVIACVVAIYFVTIFVGGRSAKFFVQRQKTLGDVNGYIEEMLNGQKVVKVFCHEEAAKQVFDGKNEDLREKTKMANIYGNILGPINNNMSHIEYVIVAIIGGFMAIKGKGGLTLGMLASFLVLSRSFSQPIGMISQQINSVVMALAGARRVFTLMDEKSEEDHGKVALVYALRDEEGKLVESETRTGTWAWKTPIGDGTFRYTEVRGDIRINNVDFGYEEGKLVLHGINIFAKPGQKIAFVGSTGAGKTTITNLINRFYDTDRGEVLYDGIEIKNIKKDDLRRSLGVVLQDVNLFTGTIMDNIRYGRLDATDEEVIAAAKLANAHSFIEKLPDGYNTVISGTSSQLSQGQCQLLSIARCAVADPPVMILDEATSSIDTRTEALIQQGMDALMADRTVFVIAHRLSTIQNSNAIMVLEAGRIIERGDHDELIEQKGRYYQLYTGKNIA